MTTVSTFYVGTRKYGTQEPFSRCRKFSENQLIRHAVSVLVLDMRVPAPFCWQKALITGNSEMRLFSDSRLAPTDVDIASVRSVILSLAFQSGTAASAHRGQHRPDLKDETPSGHLKEAVDSTSRAAWCDTQADRCCCCCCCSADAIWYWRLNWPRSWPAIAVYTVEPSSAVDHRID